MHKVKHMGEFPAHIKSEDLFLYFLYAFDYSWNLEAFDEIDDIYDYFERSLLEFMGENTFTDTQKWWALCLILLKRVARQGKLAFALETMTLVGSRWLKYSDTELEEIINLSEASMQHVIAELVVIRPVEYIPLKMNLTNSEFGGMSLLEKKEPIVNLFKKHLKQKDLIQNIMVEYSILNVGELKKFTNIWEMALELYVGYFLAFSAAGVLNGSKENNNLEKEIKNLVEVFLKTVIASDKDTSNFASALISLHCEIIRS